MTEPVVAAPLARRSPHRAWRPGIRRWVRLMNGVEIPRYPDFLEWDPAISAAVQRVPRAPAGHRYNECTLADVPLWSWREIYPKQLRAPEGL